jgi:very-short-patch-repair endonuclease
MDRKAFVERYGKLFNTTTFKDTKAKWDSLSKEEQKELTLKSRSASMKKYYQDPATHVGRKQTDDEKKKRSESLKKFYEEHPNYMQDIYKKDPSIREHQKSSLKKYYEDEDNRKKQSQIVKQTFENNPALKQKISKSVKNFWSKYKTTPAGQAAIETFIKAPRGKGTSQIEQELQSYVKSITADAIFNDKKILGGKELDIYVPSKKVAIEIDGLVWHCSKFKEDYPIQLSAKTDLCDKLGIRLIHFYDDEIREKYPIVKSIIASALGVYSRKIFARKCVIAQVGREAGDKFFMENHLAGSARASFYIGLYYNNELVQCASFGKNRFTKEKKLELIRMASLLNIQVVGGFSKIMSQVEECESYVDRRIYNASGYKSSGWTLVEKTKNGYYYTDFKNRFPRQMFMKRNLVKMWPDIDINMREEDICRLHGFYQIYNCGNYRLEWRK